MRPLFLSIALHLLLAFSAHGEDCKFQSSPRVLEESRIPQVYLAMWEEPSNSIENNPVLPQSAHFQAYQASVSQSLPHDPLFLLNRYIERATRPEDAFNVKAIAADQAGAIRPIACVEALLLDFQIQRNPAMRAMPTEFLSYFLDRNGRFRIYFLTNDSEGVFGMRRLIQEIKRDLASGWKLKGNLHNHSFFLANLESDKPQGVLAPSGSDMRVLNSQGLEIGLPRALITNGFHTLLINSEEFPLFKVTE